MPIDKITLFCFGACYGLALVTELLLLVWSSLPLRALAALSAVGGLLAHTLYLIGAHILLASQSGVLLFTAWILAVFYLFGSVHHRRLTWGLFVLPVILGLILLAQVTGVPTAPSMDAPGSLERDSGEPWVYLHIGFFVLTAVGVSIGFVASVMYLVQARRLRSKVLPGQGMRLLSLERLEKMNRRAIDWTFPLLTLGLLIGMAQLMVDRGSIQGWRDARILSTVLLWLVFAVLLYLRYGYHLRGRRVAFLTIMAFALLLVTLATSHQIRPGGAP